MDIVQALHNQDGKGRKTIFPSPQNKRPVHSRLRTWSATSFGRPQAPRCTSQLHDLRGDCRSIYTVLHARFPALSCIAHSQWHEFLFISAAHISSVNSDRSVIGHNCLAVPLNTSWCTIHIVQLYKHTFISLISDSHTKDITHFISGDKMYNIVVQQIAHHVERQYACICAQLHHSDVSVQSGSIARTARSTGCEPNLVDGDDEDLKEFENRLASRSSCILSFGAQSELQLCCHSRLACSSLASLAFATPVAPLPHFLFLLLALNHAAWFT